MSQTELYRFVEGSTVTCRTSSDTATVYGGETYTPTPIGRTEPETKVELSRANLDVNMGMDDAFARRYLNSVIDSVVTLTLFVKEAETGAVSVVWKGRMTGVKPTMSQIKLVFESVFTSLRRPGLRRRFQRNCPHVLYGRGCFVDKSLFALAGTVASVAGLTVVVAAAGTKPDGYFRGGIIQAPDGTLRFITNHVGTTLYLIREIDSLVASAAVTLYPGCDRTRETCVGTFNNLYNNGSTPFIPIKNPYGGISFI